MFFKEKLKLKFLNIERKIKLLIFEKEDISIVDTIKNTLEIVLKSPNIKIDWPTIILFLGKWLPFSFAVGITIGIIASLMDLFITYINKFLSKDLIYFFIYPIIIAYLTGKVLKKYPQVAGPGIGYSLWHLKTKVYISFKTLFLKFIFSTFTLAGGFIAGREGPSFFLGVGLGEWLGRVYGFSRKYKDLLGLIGGGAFTGALLKAPLGSSIFAMELEHVHGFNYRPFIPMIIASILSYLTFSFFRGVHVFIKLNSKPIWNLKIIPYIILLGLIVSFLIYIYTIVFHTLNQFSRNIPIYKRPLVGTILGVLLLFALVKITKNTSILSAPANMKILTDIANIKFSIKNDILIIFGTIFITSLTLGFGIPGGLVLPVLIIGAAVGNIFGHYFPKEMTTFTLAGMSSALAAAAKTPLAAIVMITEMTHDNVVIPMTAAVITSYLSSLGYSIYLGQENIFKKDTRKT